MIAVAGAVLFIVFEKRNNIDSHKTHRASWVCAVSHTPVAVTESGEINQPAEEIPKVGLYQDPKKMATIVISDFLNSFTAESFFSQRCIDAGGEYGADVSNAIKSIKYQLGGKSIPVIEFSVDSMSSDVAIEVMTNCAQAFATFVADEGRRRVEKVSAWPMHRLKVRQKRGEDVSVEMLKLQEELNLIETENPKVYTVKKPRLLW